MLTQEKNIEQDALEKPFSMKEDPDWKALRHGDIKALEILFRKYYDSLMHYGLRFINDREEVDDCIQSLFLVIWERKEFVGPSSSAKHYLFASLRRMLLKNSTASKKHITLDPELLDFHITFSPESELINDQTELETIRLLQNAIQRLPARQKEALFLKYYQDNTFHEISSIMNISPRAVYKLIYKAMDHLNKELKPKSQKTFDLLYISLIKKSKLDIINI